MRLKDGSSNLLYRSLNLSIIIIIILFNIVPNLADFTAKVVRLLFFWPHFVLLNYKLFNLVAACPIPDMFSSGIVIVTEHWEDIAPKVILKGFPRIKRILWSKDMMGNTWFWWPIHKFNIRARIFKYVLLKSYPLFSLPVELTAKELFFNQNIVLVCFMTTINYFSIFKLKIIINLGKMFNILHSVFSMWNGQWLLWSPSPPSTECKLRIPNEIVLRRHIHKPI